MHWKSIAALAFLAAALAALYLWGRDAEEVAGVATPEVPVFDGVDVARIQSFRIEHLAHDEHVTIERDAAGAWYLTDPIAYPASAAVVSSLIGHVRSNRGLPFPGVDPAELGLEPPWAVLTVRERLGESRRETVVEVGDVTLDGDRVYVRTDGRALRTPRNLHSTLQRFAEDWRSRRCTTFEADEVIALVREGEIRLDAGEELLDLDLEILRDVGWKCARPFEALVDPYVMGLLVTRLESLRVGEFVDDSPEDLARYGLDRPAFRVSVDLAGGSRETLAFAPDPAEWPGEAAGPPPPDADARAARWYVVREGFDHVWGMRYDDFAGLLVHPLDLLDHRLVRAARSDVTSVTCTVGEDVVAIERRADGWWVSEEGEARPADAGRVEDLLVGLETAELAGFLPGAPFEPREPEASIRVETESGNAFGGEFGAAYETADFGGVHFLRIGDGIASVVEPELLELVPREAAALESLEILSLDQLRQARLTLRQGGREAVFVRDPENNRWSPRGMSLEASHAFYDVVDVLHGLKADHWLPESAGPLREPIEVVIEETLGGSTRYVLGLDAEGELVCEIGGRRARPSPRQTRGDLHERLSALIAG